MIRFLRILLLLFWLSAILAGAVGLVTTGASLRERKAVQDLIVNSQATGLDLETNRARLSAVEERLFVAQLVAAAGSTIAIGIPALRFLHRMRKRRRR